MDRFNRLKELMTPVTPERAREIVEEHSEGVAIEAEARDEFMDDLMKAVHRSERYRWEVAARAIKKALKEKR